MRFVWVWVALVLATVSGCRDGQRETASPAVSARQGPAHDPPAAPARSAPPAASPAAVGAPEAGARGLRAVDWGNREYVPGLAELQDGMGVMREYEELGGLHDTTEWRLVHVGYGDYDGDGVEEAGVLVKESWYGPRGGQNEHTDLYVYELGKSGPVSLGHTTIVSGTRVEIERGRVIVRGGTGCTALSLKGSDWKPAQQPCEEKD